VYTKVLFHCSNINTEPHSDKQTWCYTKEATSSGEHYDPGTAET